MSKNIEKLIILIAIILVSGMLLERFKPDYHYEIHGEQMGFSVRVNKTNGERCLLREGAVRSISNWRDLAKTYPVPLNVCITEIYGDNDSVVNKNEKTLANPIFEDLIPKNTKQ